MKRWSLPLLVMFVMICLFAESLRSAPQDESSQANETALLKRIEQLEKRVAQLEKSQQTTIVPARSQVWSQEPARLIPGPRTVPEQWKEKQINGMKYYIVPLSTSKKSTSYGTDPHRTETSR
ncbi:hypothetical protein Enr10x_22270 [Gimesia panareensis]|uniref:Uncharacterized protein n=1 Tax=Gimesia panareensis TaxID=2527978 RepID=A0A517Q5N8_9PLAN|nr:hypothetical protein [Gimesia panareensis]QDT26915.1 hypothetical protein Enr10x_22270 [Gimesia panareensis]